MISISCKRCDGMVFGGGEYELCDQCLEVLLFGGDARSENYEKFVAFYGRAELDRRTAALRLEYAEKIERFNEELARYRAKLLRQPDLIPPPPVEIREIVAQAGQLEVDLIRHLRSHHAHLASIPPDIFEHLVGELLTHRGFEDVRLVGRDANTSADLYASIINPSGSRVRFFIEVKRHGNKVGIQVVNQVLGAMFTEKPRFGWHAAILVSLGGFSRFKKHTPQSLDLLGLTLQDRGDLIRWLEGYEPNRSGLWLPRPPRHMPSSSSEGEPEESRRTPASTGRHRYAAPRG